MVKGQPICRLAAFDRPCKKLDQIKGGKSMVRLASLLVLLLSSTSVFAETTGAADAFGKREGIEDVSLSPDGNKVAYIVPDKGQGSRLFTVDLANGGQPKAALAASGDPDRLSDCEWVSNARLICRVTMVIKDSGERVGISRLIAVNSDGSELKIVSVRQSANADRLSYFGGNLVDLLPGDDGAVLLGREYVPESKIGSLIAKTEDGYGVDRVDTQSLAAKTVVSPNKLATEYISDGQGTVRIMGIMKTEAGYDSGIRRYLYRISGQKEWNTLSEYDSKTGSGFDPYAVDPTENAAYGFENTDGRLALYKVKLDGSLAKELIYGRSDVDIDGLIKLGRQKRIVGLTFATDKRQSIYFDPALKKLGGSLSKALPNAPIVNFGGMSADEQKLIVWTGSDTNPGQYYYFNKANNNVSPLFASRPDLQGFKLAEVKSVNVKAADGTIVPAYLTLPVGSSGKGLPAIVMPHGGPSSRDEWGFDWLAQFYANRGFAVLQPNYRGSSGFGDQWYQNNGFQSWKVAIGDVNDSGRWLVSEGIADPAKLAIVGWSYGGYAALQSAVLDPELFKAIIAIAPVTDLAKLKEERRYYMNYKIVRDFIGSGPHVEEGSPAQNAGKIKAPTMLFHGDLDRNVGVYQSRYMADRLKSAGKSVEITVYPKLDHQLEDSAARSDMLAKSDAFLRKALGLPEVP
jgi:dipeptidyl aminopeptidase/acylaminoacyl peptidase